MSARTRRRQERYEPKHALPVSRSAERRSTFFVLLVMLLSSGLVVGTSAEFDASNTEGASRFAMASLDPPTNFAGEMAGTQAALSWWTPLGEANEDAGYEVLWADAGPPSDDTGTPPGCGGAGAYTKIGDTSNAAFNDTSANTRTGSDQPGRWSCYQVRTVYPYPVSASPWTSQAGNPVKEVQVGFVARSVLLTNVDTPFTLKSGDTVRVTFNQPVDIATGPPNGLGPATGSAPRICTTWDGGIDEVLIGATGDALARCTDTETISVGRLQDPDIRLSHQTRYRTSWAWSNCTSGHCRVLTATLAEVLSSYTYDVDFNFVETPGEQASTSNGDPWTFVPASTLLSGQGATGICTTNPSGGLCRPVSTGQF